MSVGTAVFLTGIFLSLIGLYAATKDRWRWRLFVKRASITLASLAALVILTGAGIYSLQFIPWAVPPQTEYSRIKIGIAPDEVIYVKGMPSSVMGEISKDPDWPGWQPVVEVKNIEKGKTVKDFQDWTWGEGGSRIDVAFDPATRSRVIAVECYSSDKRSRCPPIEGILDGSSEAEVVKRFGEPDVAKITGTSKRMSYERLGVFFNLEQEVVYMLGVHDPKWKHE